MTTLRATGGLGLRTFTFVTGLAIAVGLVTGVAIFGVNRTNAASCTTNDIMKCGFTTPSDFISKVEANNNGVNGMADLQAIYAHYGLTSADYNKFAAHAVQGEAMRDGRIVVNGRTVGTGGMSIGRLKSYQGSNPFAVSIGGHTYFGNVNSQAFASGVSEIPVYVLLDSNGGFKFAVMPACGNPEFPASTPPPPVKATAACQVLNKTADPSQANTFDFTASAVKTGSATITKFVYDFGDGSPTVTEADGSVSVPHTYTRAGTFTASVTVFANLPGQPNAQLPVVVMCTKQVTIAPPPVAPMAVAPACKLLTATPSLDNKMAFSFLVTAQPNGDTLTSADFNFGDGNTQEGVQPNGDGVTASAAHTYTTAGTFTASAVLHFREANGQPVTAPACTAVASPIAPPVATTTTQVLPNTGAGDTIGIFLGTVGVGTLGYRVLLRRRLDRQ